MLLSPEGRGDILQCSVKTTVCQVVTKLLLHAHCQVVFFQASDRCAMGCIMMKRDGDRISDDLQSSSTSCVSHLPCPIYTEDLTSEISNWLCICTGTDAVLFVLCVLVLLALWLLCVLLVDYYCKSSGFMIRALPGIVISWSEGDR